MTNLLGKLFTRLSTRVVLGLFEGSLVPNLFRELFIQPSLRIVFGLFEDSLVTNLLGAVHPALHTCCVWFV